MAARFTDNEVAALPAEPKPVAEDYRQRLRLRDKRGHREAELELDGAAGSRFWIVARQASSNALDFPVILAVSPVGSNLRFRLRRHNGKSREHTNPIERNTFYDFHIHMATERYQQLGMKEDSYAEPTERYGDYHGALTSLCTDCAVELAAGAQNALFPEFEA